MCTERGCFSRRISQKQWIASVLSRAIAARVTECLCRCSPVREKHRPSGVPRLAEQHPRQGVRLKRLIISIVGTLLAASAFASTPEDVIRQNLTKSGVQVGKISLNAAGLYTVSDSAGQILYTDAAGKYLIVGPMYDAQTHENLTEGEVIANLPRVDWSSLPLQDAIKTIKGNGARKIAIFSDPDCPYCRALETDVLPKINDVTIYTFLYPIDLLHPDASHKARLIWCAADRAAAWQDWTLRTAVPTDDGKCATPIERNAAIAAKYKITGTPTLVFVDGTRLQGVRMPDDIEKHLSLVH